jgi:hypothetical protein
VEIFKAKVRALFEAGMDWLGITDPHVVKMKHRWHIECVGPDGVVKWVEEFDNIVVTAGKDKYLDATVKTGLAPTPAWYVGLKDTGTPVAADIMSSHSSWATITPYSNATDPTYNVSGNSIASGVLSNSVNKAVFNCNATDDVYGAFIKSDNTKGGTTGTLLCVGDFAALRSVVNLDTLNVQVTLTVA